MTIVTLLSKAAAVWLVILICAILNGGLRDAILLQHLEKPVAFVLSGITLCAIVVVVTLVFIRWLNPIGVPQAFSIGLFWLCLTLAFEFSFGRLVQRREWSELLEAYLFKDGNLWPLVLVVTLLAPLLALRLRG